MSVFFIHPDSIESRFGLSVGSLFAVVGNKYVIDSALPESSSFTLVDSLHGITLFFILIIIVCCVHSLNLVKKHNIDRANRFDRYAMLIALVVYLTLNFYLIYMA